MSRTPSPKRPAILATSVAALLSLGLLLLGSQAPADEYWDGTTTIGSNIANGKGGGGTWDNITTNWVNSSGTNPVGYDPTQTAHFASIGGVVTLNANIAFTALEFDADAYFIEPSASYVLMPTGAATITALAGDIATIDAPITGTGSLTIGGAGTVTLRNANTYSGGTTLANGATLIVDDATALGTGTLAISGAGTTIGSQIQGNTGLVIENPVSVTASSFSVVEQLGGANFTFDGTVNLNGATRTIIGASTREQVQFGTGGIGVTGETAGVNFNTPFTATGDYVAFIFNGNNTNTYTGLTTVNKGAFLVFEGNTTDGGIHGNVDIEGNGVVDYLGGAASQIVPTATVTDNSNGNSAGGLFFGGLDFYTTSGETLMELDGSGTVYLAASTLTVSQGTFSGVMSDGDHTESDGVTPIEGGGLTKAGVGTLILSGANNYSGPTFISSGTLQAGAVNTLSKISAITLGTGGTLDLHGFNQTVGSIADASSSAPINTGTIDLGSATLTTGTNNTSTTFSGVIQDGGAVGGLTKIGTGTLTLAGANNYVGATTVNGGVLAIDPSSTTPTVLNAGSGLVVGGGTFQLNGMSTGPTTQVMNGLTVNAGSSQVTVNDPSGAGTTLDLTGGGAAGIGRSTGGIVDFNASTGTFGSDATVMTTQANDATGIIGAWATVNNGAAFAMNNGANVIVAYTGYTPPTGTVIPNDATANVALNGATSYTTAAATTTINTLSQQTATASTVDTAGGTLQVGAVGGIFINNGDASLTIGVAGNAGTLTAGGGVANAPGELILENNNTAASANVLTINSVITDNGTGSVSVTVAGTGTTVINGVDTYSGQTLVTNGTLETGALGAIPTGSALVVQGGTLNLNGFNQSVASLSDGGSTAGTIALNGATLTVNASTNTTYSGLLTDGGSPGSLTQNGTGTLTISNPANTYSGGTNLNSGTLNVNGSPVDGSGTPLGTGTLNIAGGTTLSTSLEPAYGASGTTLTNAINANGDFSVATNVDAAHPNEQNFTLSGNIDLMAPAPATRTITGLTSGGNVILSGVISDGGVTFDAGAGVTSTTFTYSGTAVNTYTGLTVVNSGVVLALNRQQIAPTAIDPTPPTLTAIAGDLDVEGTGVVLMQNSSQFATDPTTGDGTSNLTVNSTGNTINGAHYDGLELAGTSQTIASLMGSGTVGLGGGTLVVNPTGTTLFSGVIEDGHFGPGGGLTVNGVGTLQLSGANTYTGPTTVLGGTLQAEATNTIPQMSAVIVDSQNSATFDLNNFNQSIGSLADGPNGGGTVTLGSATLTTGNDNTSTSFSGSILGNGGLTKVGAGGFDLTGTGNNYTGATLVNGGTLEVDGSITSPVTVNNGSTFVLGTNGMVNSGTSTTPVTLNTGGTFDNNGNLTVTGVGSVGVAAPGAGVMINNNSGALISGETGIVVSNPTGLVEITNDGTITGTGGIAINALTSAGLTLYNFGIINGQVLFGPGMNTVVLATGITPEPATGGGPNSTLRLAGGGTGEVNLNNFPNFGMLTKVGGGLWTLDGGGSFPGGTSITNGTINLQGTLRSNVIVQPLGELIGIGTVFGNVVNVGTIQPGFALLTSPINPPTLPGTLHVEGNFTQGDFGQLIIQVGGSRPGEYSSVQVGGHAYLGGVLVLQQLNKGPNLSLGQTIDIITASGGISGGFTKIINPLTSDTVISPKVLYEPDAVLVEGVQGSFEAIQRRGVPLNANETAIAVTLDHDLHSPKTAALVGYLDNQAIQKLPADFDKIAPEQVGSVYRLGFSLADVQSNNLQRRASDLREGVSGFSAAGFQTSGGPDNVGGLAGPNGSDGKTAAAAAPDKNWGGFITGLGDFIHVGNTGNAQGYNLTTGGFTLGADYKVTENLAIGVSLGYTGTDSKLANDGHLQVNGGKAGVYGTYWQDGFYGDLLAGGGYNSYEIRRGALQGDARGNTGGGEADVLVAGGYDWRMEGLTIGPTASMEYTYLGMVGFNERGSLAPLNYPTQHDDSLRSTLGVKATYDWRIGNVLVRPEAQIAWQHEFASRDASVDASFESGPGNLFTVSDSEIGRDSLLLSGGVSVLWNPRTSTYIYYDADLLRKEYDSQSVTGGVRVNF